LGLSDIHITMPSKYDLRRERSRICNSPVEPVPFAVSVALLPGATPFFIDEPVVDVMQDLCVRHPHLYHAMLLLSTRFTAQLVQIA
jgi:hypothetical protein